MASGRLTNDQFAAGITQVAIDRFGSVEGGDVVIVDEADGKGPILREWNTLRIGLPPTPEEIDEAASRYAPPSQPTITDLLARIEAIEARLTAAGL